LSRIDSAAKPLLTGFLKKMGVEIIEVFSCREAHFSENRGFCSRINHNVQTFNLKSSQKYLKFSGPVILNPVLMKIRIVSGSHRIGPHG